MNNSLEGVDTLIKVSDLLFRLEGQVVAAMRGQLVCTGLRQVKAREIILVICVYILEILLEGGHT